MSCDRCGFKPFSAQACLESQRICFAFFFSDVRSLFRISDDYSSARGESAGDVMSRLRTDVLFMTNLSCVLLKALAAGPFAA